MAASSGEVIDPSEAALDRYLTDPARYLECDLCGEPWAERGGGPFSTENGHLCATCAEWDGEGAPP